MTYYEHQYKKTNNLVIIKNVIILKLYIMFNIIFGSNKKICDQSYRPQSNI